MSRPLARLVLILSIVGSWGAAADWLTPPPVIAADADAEDTVQPLPAITAPEEVPAGPKLVEPEKKEDAVIVVPPPPKIWESSIELGIAGSNGNTNVTNVRTVANVKRKTDAAVLTSNLSYRYANDDSGTTANRLFFDGRNEWLFPPSRWTWYVHETTEYDQFQSFDVRVTADTGIGYQFIKNDFTTFTGRFGGGFSHEIGGPDESYVPEGVFGMTYEHQLSKKQKIQMIVDYFPDVRNFNEYRVNSQANWQVLLDEIANLTLKVGVIDRYDSTPNGAKPNDIDYTATLLWSFYKGLGTRDLVLGRDRRMFTSGSVVFSPIPSPSRLLLQAGRRQRVGQ